MGALSQENFGLETGGLHPVGGEDAENAGGTPWDGYRLTLILLWKMQGELCLIKAIFDVIWTLVLRIFFATSRHFWGLISMRNYIF